MTVKEVRDLDLNQLESQVKELKHELFNLKLQKTLGQLQNTAQIRKVKRDIARMKTILTEKTGK
ncbi:MULTISPECIES: 50S ribosomal protein L29 [Streptobacillus]|uniref:Large ribosomal subunit protein uL29 n=2 Tax=Streptobacillus TaxID=34104 RepID=D1AVH0_STRM9|nr:MULTISPECIES: 50S ribosomal protein L29 [Streptobacillus]ACZ01730.1 ribosomal protein L29 [Streptobacillus moniliformis DSM 12112]AVL43278.1 50S ribosomal protein L29 [Streptobacillus moniliformis]NYV28022.1 50S ribosomal protein L29 [Streptobacillus felis]QXW66396.1 50S ribosomal protein L29 [Streptobacillus moniliformis]SQA13088.1 50S ribosomal protein L29 [Streptobacillus moniliformis]